MRRLRTIGLVAIAAVAAVIVVAVILLATLDPNEYKETIADIISRQTGLGVEIAGDLRIERSLVPTIAIDKVTIASPEPDAPQPLARIGRFDLSFDLLPLLAGEVRLRDVFVEGVDIWLRPGTLAALGNAPGPERVEPAAEAPLAFVPRFESVRARQVRVHVASAAGARTFELDELAATTPPAEGGLDVAASGRLEREPYRLTARLGSAARFLSGDADLSVSAELVALEARLEASGRVASADGALRPDVVVKIAGDRLSASLDAVGRIVPLPARPPALDLGPYRASARLTARDGTPRLDDIDAVIGDDAKPTLAVTGSVADVTAISGLDLAFRSAGDELSPFVAAVLAGLPEIGKTDVPALGPFDLKGRVAGGRDKLSATGMVLAFGGANANRLSLSGEVRDALGDPTIDVAVELAGRELATLIALAKPHVAALSDVTLPPIGAYKVTAHVQGGARRLSLARLNVAAGQPSRLRVEAEGTVSDLIGLRGLALPFVVRTSNVQDVAKPFGVEAPKLPLRLAGTLKDIDGGYEVATLELRTRNSDLAGRIAVRTKDGRPSIDATLRSRLIDLDELPPRKAAGKDSAAPGSWTPPGVLGTVSLDVQAVRAGGGTLVGPTSLRVSSDARRLSIELGDKGGAGGHVSGRIRLVHAGPKPSASVDLAMKEVEVGRLLTALSGPSRLSGGLASGKIVLTGEGGSPQALTSSLSGTASLAMGTARLDGGGAGLMIGDVLIGVFDAINPFSKSDDKLGIKCGAVRAWVKDGVVLLPGSAGIETEKFAALASGHIDLKAETVELSVRPVATEGLGVSVGQALAGLVEVRGPLADPHIGVSELGAATMAARLAAAVATGGISYLAELALVDRGNLRKACTTASNATLEKQAEATPGQPAGAAPQREGGVVKKGVGAVKGVIEGTGKAISEGLKGLFGAPSGD